MSFEKIPVNMPTEEEKQKWENAPDYDERLRQEKIETDKIENGIQEILTKIDAQKLRDEALQEVKDKGLFVEDESLPTSSDQQKRLLLLVEARKIAEGAKKFADESLNEEEKKMAFELLNQCESNLYQIKLRYTQDARQSDLKRELYNGEQTAESEIQALENLALAGIMTEDEARTWKTNLLDELARGVRT